MTDTDDTYEDHDDDYIDAKAVRQLRQQLKTASKEAARAKELEARLADMERRDTLRTAGLELSDRQMKALLATHEGDFTPDAVKATAADLGFIKTEEQTVDADLAATQRIAEATGSQPAPTASADKDAELAKATSPEEVMAILERYRVPTTWNDAAPHTSFSES